MSLQQFLSTIYCNSTSCRSDKIVQHLFLCLQFLLLGLHTKYILLFAILFDSLKAKRQNLQWIGQNPKWKYFFALNFPCSLVKILKFPQSLIFQFTKVQFSKFNECWNNILTVYEKAQSQQSLHLKRKYSSTIFHICFISFIIIVFIFHWHSKFYNAHDENWLWNIKLFF